MGMKFVVTTICLLFLVLENCSICSSKTGRKLQGEKRQLIILCCGRSRCSKAFAKTQSTSTSMAVATNTTSTMSTKALNTTVTTSVTTTMSTKTPTTTETISVTSTMTTNVPPTTDTISVTSTMTTNAQPTTVTISVTSAMTTKTINTNTVVTTSEALLFDDCSCPVNCSCSDPKIPAKIKMNGLLSSPELDGKYEIYCGSDVIVKAAMAGNSQLCCSVCMKAFNNSGRNNGCKVNTKNTMLLMIGNALQVNFDVASKNGNCSEFKDGNYTSTVETVKSCSGELQAKAANGTMLPACPVVESMKSCPQKTAVSSGNPEKDNACSLKGEKKDNKENCGMDQNYSCQETTTPCPVLCPTFSPRMDFPLDPTKLNPDGSFVSGLVSGNWKTSCGRSYFMVRTNTTDPNAGVEGAKYCAAIGLQMIEITNMTEALCVKALYDQEVNKFVRVIVDAVMDTSISGNRAWRLRRSQYPLVLGDPLFYMSFPRAISAEKYLSFRVESPHSGGWRYGYFNHNGYTWPGESYNDYICVKP